MAYGMFRLKIEDFPTWKTDWDQGRDFRNSGGQKEFHIFRMVHDPNEIILLIEWDSLDNMKQFMESPELKETMQRSSVQEMVSQHFLELVEKGSSA